MFSVRIFKFLPFSYFTRRGIEIGTERTSVAAGRIVSNGTAGGSDPEERNGKKGGIAAIDNANPCKIPLFPSPGLDPPAIVRALAQNITYKGTNIVYLATICARKTRF